MREQRDVLGDGVDTGWSLKRFSFIGIAAILMLFGPLSANA